ncbi:TELO2-interacting protein 1 homolog [Engraulis encrasicolus]|uniref:TELO2-interacting protein 1 homolog n=1 Tax=Engraulis encrasicolus TaxID=184585 RepID=UPI002FD0F6A1
MTQIDNPKEAFAFLRPSCVTLTRAPTISNVKILQKNLHTVSDEALQQIQDYVLFPLRFVLKVPGPKQENLVLAVMDTVGYVLEKTTVSSWESLQNLFTDFCMCISIPEDPGKPAPVSEELKSSVLKCMNNLLHAAYGDVVFKLYELSMLPTLGAAMSLLLALVQEERAARGVQTAALKCLLSLAFQCDCPEDHVIPNKQESYALGNALASFLPGASRTLSQVICHNTMSGHAVITRATRALYRIIGAVMDDAELANQETAKAASSSSSSTKAPPRQPGKLGELEVHRSSNWTKETSQRLSMVFQKIISCISGHQHWKVRLEMVSMCEYLLTRCSSSLSECTGSFLEALVGAVNDEDISVREKASKALQKISQSESDTAGRVAFTDILSEKLHALSTSLPQLMKASDDQRKLFVLRVFLGYLKVLGPSVEVVLNSAVHLNRISKAMMLVLEMDVTNVRIVEEKNFPVVVVQDKPEAYDEANIVKKDFLYFTDDKIHSVIREICQMLGYYGNLNILVDHFLDLYRESSMYRKQSVLVLNEIIAGAVGTDLKIDLKPATAIRSHLELAPVISLVIEEYISAENWQLPTSHDHSDEQDESRQRQTSLLAVSQYPSESCTATAQGLKQLNSNIWQICLQLEGIGVFSRVLGPAFDPFLKTVLYAVLEKVGDKSLLVSQSAVSTLASICQVCGYDSLIQLINRNADYLLNDISLHLGRPSVQSHAPRVFAAMVTHSDASLLPLVLDVVQDVLTAVDLHHDNRASEFLEVLHAVMKGVARVVSSNKKEESSPETENKDVFDARKFLLEYRTQTELAEGIVESENVEDEQGKDVPSPMEENAAPDVDVEMEVDLPPHVTIAKDVMERCIHLLSLPSLRLRLKVLDMLELGVRVMSECKDQLLPMVHRCWPVLERRLNDEDPFIVPQAFKVLCSLGEVCTDFLRKRVSKSVIPTVAAFLTKQALTSMKTGPHYTQTLNFKRQLTYLQGLGSLCVSLDLAESDVFLVTDACLPYLSALQPPKLQEAGCSVFQCLIAKDPDVVWFTLCEQYCPYTYPPPHEDLLPVNLSGMGRQKNEYSSNVMKLLEEFKMEETGNSV